MTYPRRAAVHLVHLPLALGTIAVVTVLGARLPIDNPATISTTFLLVILVVAATSRLWVAVVASFAAMLSFNFFFLPPYGTLTIADPRNWVALFALLAVSLVGSHLSANARDRAEEAVHRRDELARLFDLSRDILLLTESEDAIAGLARAITRRFDLPFAAVAMPRATDWQVTASGTGIGLDETQLWSAFTAARSTLEFDAYARTYAGHRTTTVDGSLVHLVPLRAGTVPIGILAAAGRPVEPGTLDALAGIAAIAIERAQLLAERKNAALTRQSEALKTTLLASIGHDLRTPLTAIRVAAVNIKAAGRSEAERTDQSDLILTEAERLTRLFDNILEMARIDAGAVAAERRWSHPSEIVDAARDQVQAALADHRLCLSVTDAAAVNLDPRLAASALARVLENAAHYAPPGSPIELAAGITADGLTFTVRDHGAGIPAGDLSRLFERFYRGDAAKTRASGAGMGLWIARSLLSAQGGRIWAENPADGGARFTIVIPVAMKPASLPSETSLA